MPAKVESRKVTLHEDLDTDPELLTTKYTYSKMFTVRAAGDEGEEVEEYTVTLIYEEVTRDTDDPRDRPDCYLVSIDADELPSEQLTAIAIEKVEQWAKRHGIHVPAKGVKR